MQIESAVEGQPIDLGITKLASLFPSTVDMFSEASRLDRDSNLAGRGAVLTTILAGSLAVWRQDHNRLARDIWISGAMLGTIAGIGRLTGYLLRECAGEIADGMQRGEIIVKRGQLSSELT